MDANMFTQNDRKGFALLTLYHSIVSQRRSFAFLGPNTPYLFKLQDLRLSLQYLNLMQSELQI